MKTDEFSHVSFGPWAYFDEQGNYDPGKIDRVKEEYLKRKQEKEAQQKRNTVEIPIPFIEGDGTKGPIYISKDWYVKKKKKKIKKNAKESKAVQIELMQALAKRDKVLKKLAALDPIKKKDSKKIVKLNIKLKDLELEIDALQRQVGTDLNELNHGTKWQQRWESFKKKIKKVGKSIKKWYKSNKEIIWAVASAVVPAVIGIIVNICTAGAAAPATAAATMCAAIL